MLKHPDEAAAKRDLFAAVLALKTASDCEAFFADLCTPAELEALSGRLNEKSLALLGQCGLQFDAVKWKEKLVLRCSDFPVDVMMVRDDDIPEYVASGTCEMGIVGLNVLEERRFSSPHGADGIEI